MSNIRFLPDILQDIKHVIDSGEYILGKVTHKFEKSFAEYIGSKYCVGVNSGTDALILGMRALGIGQGDEVILPSLTATATGSAVLQVGASPVFVDVDPQTYTIDPVQVSNSITSKTKAVIAVHLYGGSCDMDRLKDICTSRNIYLIEDVAQACGGSYKGKKLGSFGDLACFSFYPTKNLGAIGDAGAICLNSESLKDLIVQLRQYGWNLSRVSELPGINSRLDELQAAILLRKLRGLDESNQRRIEVAQLYDRWLDPKKFLIPKKIKDTVHVFHLYVVRLQNLDRAKLVKVLASQGIQLGIHYFPPTHLHPAFLHVSHGRLEVTESFSQEVVSLPMYPELSDDSVKRICEVINDV